MQTLVFYVDATSTLGIVRDYANARSESAPTFTRGVAARLKMRLFSASDTPDPYPLSELSSIASWQFVMDTDFDESTSYKLVADHAEIAISSVKDTINENTYEYTQIDIPISQMNTQELSTLLGTSESVATLHGELVGFDSTGAEVFVLQVKNFTIRNRISSAGNPTEIASEYLNESQVRALMACGFELIFATSANADADSWHSNQEDGDLWMRMRLSSDTRVWTEGNASDYGWSDPIGLIAGPEGVAGTDGLTCYVAFAEDAEGSGFTLNPAKVTDDYAYLAFTNSVAEPSEDDFVGKWVRFRQELKADGVSIADPGDYFSGKTVEDALQELGSQLEGVEELLEGI